MDRFPGHGFDPRPHDVCVVASLDCRECHGAEVRPVLVTRVGDLGLWSVPYMATSSARSQLGRSFWLLFRVLRFGDPAGRKRRGDTMRSFLRLSVFVILSSALGSSASLAQAVFTVNTTVD